MQTVKSEELDAETAAHYLTLYVGEADWRYHLGQLWNRLSKKQYTEDERRQLMRKIIACATLLPVYDHTKIPELPENLIYWVSSYNQFNEKDWYSLYREMLKRDAQIKQWRDECLSLGIVYPLEFSPVTRQAFNWLFGKAEESGAVNDDNKADMIRKYQNLVLAYGGNTICSLFIREDHRVKKIRNWRSAYFFERAIHEVYTVDQLIKIKKAELAKTNAKLVKKIRQD